MQIVHLLCLTTTTDRSDTAPNLSEVHVQVQSELIADEELFYFILLLFFTQKGFRDALGFEE